MRQCRRCRAIRYISSVRSPTFLLTGALEQNPLEDIKRTEHVRYTMVNGRIYESDTMDEVGNRTTKRPKSFFESLDGGGGDSGERAVADGTNRLPCSG